MWAVVAGGAAFALVAEQFLTGALAKVVGIISLAALAFGVWQLARRHFVGTQPNRVARLTVVALPAIAFLCAASVIILSGRTSEVPPLMTPVTDGAPAAPAKEVPQTQRGVAPIDAQEVQLPAAIDEGRATPPNPVVSEMTSAETSPGNGEAIEAPPADADTRLSSDFRRRLIESGADQLDERAASLYNRMASYASDTTVYSIRSEIDTWERDAAVFLRRHYPPESVVQFGAYSRRYQERYAAPNWRAPEAAQARSDALNRLREKRERFAEAVAVDPVI